MRAQQQEKRRLSLNLSFFEVGPWIVVPLMERIAVPLSGDRKTCPRKPTVGSSQPKGKLFQWIWVVKQIDKEVEITLTYEVPSRINVIPVLLTWKCIGISAHARKLRERVSILNIRSKYLHGLP